MAGLTIFMMVRIWKHVNNTMQSFKTTDCAFARVVEYMDRGIKQADSRIIETNSTNQMMNSGLTQGFFGFSNYEIFVGEILANYDKIKSSNLSVGSLTQKVYQLSSNLGQLQSLTETQT